MAETTAPFADGTRVLHIGPHKTGTTGLQRAFWASRDLLAEHGVLWAGGTAHPMAAAIAGATGGQIATARPGSGEHRWLDLLAELDASTARVSVLSSEFFSDAPAERIPQIIGQLGADRTQVVVTLRPLTRILASQWQQYMQNQPQVRYGDNPSYEGWLDIVLNDPEQTAITPTFWRRHRHDRLIQRWVEQVGADRLSVVVVDDAHPRGVLASFERLLGLPDGLVREPEATANRSLTLPEVAMVRGFNAGWIERGWSDADYTRFVRFSSVRHLMERTPLPDEPKIKTPQWAVDRANEIGAEMVAAISDLGVRVDGDLALLHTAVPRGVGDNPVEVAVPADAVARFTAGLVKVVATTPARGAVDTRRLGPIETAVREDKIRRGVRDEPAHGPVPPAERPVAELSRGALLRLALGRVRRRLRRGR
ncbi:hypothetical protein GON03_14635 [Nocardioides sp. MAH-18]|uniref:Sulfotransferase family protein n=1 Tax=Nocardioides agri TaxID=2682843 RepID=A0A6L6XT84_9ACTN|nr:MULTISPECIES: hypothetical protein [unclassified Nocardioides]MBA2955570.1 hypothetical protein [Nocardioides sp. CGMCC 1.13656]MVQ50420.1 hypothetical protein [Nocardioides sp. MAH-18]